MTFTMTEAKKKLTKIVRLAETGDRVEITRYGVAVVEIVRKQENPLYKRVFGGFEKQVQILDPDWARPENDVAAWLEGDV